MEADTLSKLPPEDRAMTAEEVAREFGVTTRTIRRWHTLRIGPPRLVLAGQRSVRYRAGDVAEWMRQQREPSACQAA